MTQEEEILLRNFETRVRQLILQYQELQHENAALHANVHELQDEAERLRSENAKLRNDYSRLKLAKMLNISDDDARDAKVRVNRLIREIDKCIALLNI